METAISTAPSGVSVGCQAVQYSPFPDSDKRNFSSTLADKDHPNFSAPMQNLAFWINVAEDHLNENKKATLTTLTEEAELHCPICTSFVLASSRPTDPYHSAEETPDDYVVESEEEEGPGVAVIQHRLQPQQQYPTNVIFERTHTSSSGDGGGSPSDGGGGSAGGATAGSARSSARRTASDSGGEIREVDDVQNTHSHAHSQQQHRSFSSIDDIMDQPFYHFGESPPTPQQQQPISARGRSSHPEISTSAAGTNTPRLQPVFGLNHFHHQLPLSARSGGSGNNSGAASTLFATVTSVSRNHPSGIPSSPNHQGAVTSQPNSGGGGGRRTPQFPPPSPSFHQTQDSLPSRYNIPRLAGMPSGGGGSSAAWSSNSAHHHEVQPVSARGGGPKRSDGRVTPSTTADDTVTPRSPFLHLSATFNGGGESARLPKSARSVVTSSPQTTSISSSARGGGRFSPSANNAHTTNKKKMKSVGSTASLGASWMVIASPNQKSSSDTSHMTTRQFFAGTPTSFVASSSRGTSPSDSPAGQQPTVSSKPESVSTLTSQEEQGSSSTSGPLTSGSILVGPSHQYSSSAATLASPRRRITVTPLHADSFVYSQYPKHGVGLTFTPRSIASSAVPTPREDMLYGRGSALRGKGITVVNQSPNATSRSSSDKQGGGKDSGGGLTDYFSIFSRPHVGSSSGEDLSLLTKDTPRHVRFAQTLFGSSEKGYDKETHDDGSEEEEKDGNGNGEETSSPITSSEDNTSYFSFLLAGPGFKAERSTHHDRPLATSPPHHSANRSAKRTAPAVSPHDDDDAREGSSERISPSPPLSSVFPAWIYGVALAIDSVIVVQRTLTRPASAPNSPVVISNNNRIYLGGGLETCKRLSALDRSFTGRAVGFKF